MEGRLPSSARRWATLRHPHFYLALIVVLHVVWGARREAETWLYLPDGDLSRILNSAFYYVPLLVLIWLWCSADARKRRLDLSTVAALLITVTFPLGVPYYLLKTHALRPALLRVGLAVFLAATCVAALWIGMTLAFNYYAVWTNHRGSVIKDLSMRPEVAVPDCASPAPYEPWTSDAQAFYIQYESQSLKNRDRTVEMADEIGFSVLGSAEGSFTVRWLEPGQVAQIRCERDVALVAFVVPAPIVTGQ